MPRYYSHSTWTVKEGRELEFVAAWKDWVAWSAPHGLGSAARLLRDVDDPRRFLSFGPWEDLETIRRWRSLPGFQERLARLQATVERFEPRTLEQVAER